MRAFESDSFQNVGDPLGRDLGGQQRLLPGRLNETLGGEIIHLVGLHFAHDADQTREVREIAVVINEVILIPSQRKR